MVLGIKRNEQEKEDDRGEFKGCHKLNDHRSFDRQATFRVATSSPHQNLLFAFQPKNSLSFIKFHKFGTAITKFPLPNGVHTNLNIKDSDQLPSLHLGRRLLPLGGFLTEHS